MREAVLPALRSPATDAEYCLSVDSPLGRYWIPLLQPLTARGGGVTVLGRLPWHDYTHADAHGAAPARLPGVRFGYSLPLRTSETTLLTESRRRRLDRHDWGKRLRLSLSIDDDRNAAEPFYRLPFGVHPGFVAEGWAPLFPAQRTASRTTRVLFSGSTDPRLYNTDLWRARKAQYGIELTRSEAVDVLREQLTDDQMLLADWNADDLPRVFDGSCRDKLFMARWNAYRGPEWPRALGAADFFLALPGVHWPLCHNIVEAMAAGCIPITNYPDWFLPSLVDGQDCLAFGDAASLVAALERALTMQSAEIERLRAGALGYYDRHLAPANVRESLDALPDGAGVYLLSEPGEPLANIRRGSIAFPGVTTA